MEKFVTDMSSPYWWVSVVIVGLLINIISGYLKSFIDSLATKSYERYKERKQKISDAFDSEAREINIDINLREWTVQEEHRLYFKCLRRTLLGIWIMGVSLVSMVIMPEDSELIYTGYLVKGALLVGLFLWFNAGSVYQDAYANSALLRRAREFQLAERGE